jgi:hypothetical protein
MKDAVIHALECPEKLSSLYAIAVMQSPSKVVKKDEPWRSTKFRTSCTQTTLVPVEFIRKALEDMSDNRLGVLALKAMEKIPGQAQLSKELFWFGTGTGATTPNPSKTKGEWHDFFLARHDHFNKPLCDASLVDSSGRVDWESKGVYRLEPPFESGNIQQHMYECVVRKIDGTRRAFPDGCQVSGAWQLKKNYSIDSASLEAPEAMGGMSFDVVNVFRSDPMLSPCKSFLNTCSSPGFGGALVDSAASPKPLGSLAMGGATAASIVAVGDEEEAGTEAEAGKDEHIEAALAADSVKLNNIKFAAGVLLAAKANEPKKRKGAAGSEPVSKKASGEVSGRKTAAVAKA